MSLTSRLSIGITFGLLLSLSTPFIVPAISHSSGFATAQAQTQSPPPQLNPSQVLSFQDVPTNYWAYDYIEGLAKLKIISGFGDGSFRPDEPVTRAQLAAIARQAFIANPAAAQPFADVPANYWAAQSISAARSSGFLSGYPGNLFKPAQNIPRAQALVSLANGLKYTSNNPQRLTAYTDANEIPAYARPAIAAADEASLVINYPSSDQLEPNRNATRADVAAFVYQALVKQGRATAVAPSLAWQHTPMATLPTVAEQISFSKNGQQLVTLTKGGASLQVWNAQTGALIKKIAAATGMSFREVAISEDGMKVTAISQAISTNAVELAAWTVATGDQLWRQPLGTAQTQLSNRTSEGLPYFQVTFSPNGQQIATQINWDIGSQSVSPMGSQTRLHDATTGDVLQSLKAQAGNGDQLMQFAFSADGKFLANAKRLSSTPAPFINKVEIWQINQNNRYDYLKTVSITADFVSLRGMTFANGGSLNVLSSQETGLSVGPDDVSCDRVRLDTLNVQTGEQTKREELPWCFGSPLSLTTSDQYYAVDGGARKTVVDYKTDRRQSFEGNSVAVGRSGNYLAVASDRNVSIFAKATSSNP